MLPLVGDMESHQRQLPASRHSTLHGAVSRMSTEDISEVPVSNEGVVFLQQPVKQKMGELTTQFSPSPDFNPTPAKAAWPVAQNQRPPLPPSGPGGATVGMSLSAFESWAISVEDYGNICGWMPPLAASYVKLLFSGEAGIPATINHSSSRHCKKCSDRAVVGDGPIFSHTRKLRVTPYVHTYRNVGPWQVIESAEKPAGRSAVGNVASVLAAGPGHKVPIPLPGPHHIEVAASGASCRPNDSNLHVTLGPDVVVNAAGCGDSDCRGDRQCRAFGVVCRSCGLKGHFWRQCPTLTPKGSAVTSSAVTVGVWTHLASLPVIVVCGNLRARCSTMAVADTGAQVSMAGRTLLNNLGILQHQLQPAPVAVNHVAGGGVRLLGSLICQLVVGPVTTNERIFFANGVERLYLSLGWYVLDWEEYQPSKDLVRSIMEFTMPTRPTLTDVRAWFGLVNQVAPFLAVAPIMEPFRELLKKPVAKSVYWDEQLQAIFSSAKDTIGQLAAAGLRYYDVSRPKAVTDYSRQGCRNLTFVTDLKALTRIFGDKELKDINNPCILNLKERTLMYSFRIKYLKGKTNCAADALSRYPMLLGHPEESDEADDELVCATIVAAASEAVEGDGGRVVDIQQVEEEAAKDDEYQLLHECVSNEGWTDRKDMEPLALRPYFRMRRHLSCQGNLIVHQ
ncbi:hypothetical protein C7M84_022732 [Penaeus vannamei]|uniref:CCHC-type domain-containing protein n=1 Tax=Penaeus vannamei TaxID=6689 RepID=A0A423U5U2_PENVA|nr:hypothetical protein C7M84_022732 [Penaeus vannamei]